MATTRIAAALAVVALSALGGCTPGGNGAPTITVTTPTASPSTPLSPTPTPVATPTPDSTLAAACASYTDSPDAATAAIDFNRFADVCLGMSYAEATAATGVPVVGETQCPWVTTLESDDSLGYYVTALSPVDTPGSEIWFFHMIWQSDPATATAYDLPRTPEGITIGSTVAQLMAAYPGATTLAVDDYSRGPRDERLVAGPDSTTYVFDITGGLVSELTWGHRLTMGAQGEYCAL